MIIQKDKIEEHDKKKDQIIEAALNRFMHFGIPKTTMNEIADDLSISKALLYYYFPDKTSLIYETANLLVDDLMKSIEFVLNNSSNCLEAFSKLIDTRIGFTQKYFMLHITDGSTDVNVHEKRYEEFLNNLKAKDLEIMSSFLEKKKKSKEIKDVDTIETSKIFLQMIVGVCAYQIHINKKTLIPTDQQFEEIKCDLKKLAEVFYNGIKNT